MSEGNKLRVGYRYFGVVYEILVFLRIEERRVVNRYVMHAVIPRQTCYGNGGLGVAASNV